MQSALNNSIVTETALVRFHKSVIHGTGGFAKMAVAAGTQVID